MQRILTETAQQEKRFLCFLCTEPLCRELERHFSPRISEHSRRVVPCGIR